MAEQYSSINSKAPNIDINLYSNAANAGIQGGNAQKTKGEALISGIKDAVDIGGKVVGLVTGAQAIGANFQNAEIRQQQIDLGNAEGVPEAKADVIRAEGAKARQESTIATIQNDILTANDAIARGTAEADLKTQYQESQIKLGDVLNKKTITEAISTGQPGNLEAVLKNPDLVSTLLRDEKFGQQFLGAASGKIDPALEKTARNQIDAVAMQKQRMEQLDQEQKLKTSYALKTQESAAEATAALQAIPEYAEASKGERFDYRRTNLYPANSVVIENGKLKTNVDGSIVRKSVDDSAIGGVEKDTGYVMTQGKKVIVPYMSREDGIATQKNLNTFKTYGSAKGFTTYNDPEEDLPPKAADPTAASFSTGGLAARGPSPTSGTSPQAINDNIVTAAKARNENAFKTAQTQGQGSSYEALITKGSSLTRTNMPTPDYIKTPQSVPVAPGTPTFTTPIPQTTVAPQSFATPEAEKHLSSVMGGADITLNTDLPTATPVVSSGTIQRINGIPALDNQPAFIKGLVAIESRGITDAVNKKSGAKGLGQFMEATAKDLGLSDEDRANPDKAIPAIIEYTSKQYDRFEKVLGNAFSSQGITIKPDPRMVLAAYNGGPEYIVRGIRAGNTTWDQMKTYIRSVKSPGAEKENLEYADKVITASIPFIRGGNASDDSYVKALINFGIVDVA